MGNDLAKVPAANAPVAVQPERMNADPFWGTVSKHKFAEFNICTVSRDENNNEVITVDSNQPNEGGYYDVVINKIHSYRIIGFRDGREDLKSIFALYGIEVKPLNSAFEEVVSNGGIYNEVKYASFFHPANNHVDVKIATVDANSIDEYIVDPVYGRNETVVFETNLYDGVKFCLN
jgi:hypothetical protein